jgi:chemotaxis protein CheD
LKCNQNIAAEANNLLSLPVGAALKKAWLTLPRRVHACEQVPCVTVNAYKDPQVEEVRVDMAAMKVECRPVELLTSVGSCIAICIYDSAHKCGGLAHIMLPHSADGPNEPLPSKYADTAVAALVKTIRGTCGPHTRLLAKIAGGANMFQNTGATGLDIGAKNIKAVRAALIEHKVRLIGEDVGSSHGRRVTFSVASGNTTVKLHNGETKKL